MKRKSLVIILLLVFFTLNCHKSKNLYVTANESLSLREEPSVFSKVILTLPRGTLVKSLDEIDKQITITEKNGKWTKVEVYEITGWVFGGYLSEEKPPEKPLLPPLPITLTYRDSIWGKGYVLILNNKSRHYLQINATFHNPTFNQTGTFPIDIPAYGSTEFGWREGWRFSHGETITLQHADYLPINSKF
ncbi:SH3 domain-containing protein [Leptospira harrisiae]|uniref:SH3 domain-containing protein n=1 Tax=Leptospira harrisiae TaxID=2023189 RepID=UPI0013FD2D04|nr:SH3 domain-containing protein [Leptospira harrisiae]